MPFKLFGLGKRPLRSVPFPTVGFFALSQLIFAHWDSSHPGVPLFPSPPTLLLFFGSLITFSVLAWDSGHCGAPPSLDSNGFISTQSPFLVVRESGHCGAPPFRVSSSILTLLSWHLSLRHWRIGVPPCCLFVLGWDRGHYTAPPSFDLQVTISPRLFVDLRPVICSWCGTAANAERPFFGKAAMAARPAFKYLSPCQFEYSAYLVWESGPFQVSFFVS